MQTGNKVVQIFMGVGGGCAYQISRREDYVVNPMRVLEKKGFTPEIWTLQNGSTKFYEGIRIRRFSSTLSLLLHVLFDRDIKLVYAQLRSHLPSLLSPLTLKKCVLVTQTYELGSNKLIEKFSLFFMKRFTRIFALTPYERQLYIKKGLRKDSVVFFPHAIDYSFFSKKPRNLDGTRKKYKIDNDDFVIISVANFRRFKNLDIMLKAFALFNKKVKKSKMLVVGEDQTRNKVYKEQYGKRYRGVEDVREVIKREGISKDVIFTGGVDYRKVRNLLYISDVFVNSADPEGMGMAVYEAASAGVPLCLSNIGSFTSVFKGKALYNPPRDAKKLSENYLKYYENLSLRRNNSRALKNHMKKWDYKIAIKRFNKVFDEILS